MSKNSVDGESEKTIPDEEVLRLITPEPVGYKRALFGLLRALSVVE